MAEEEEIEADLLDDLEAALGAPETPACSSSCSAQAAGQCTEDVAEEDLVDALEAALLAPSAPEIPPRCQQQEGHVQQAWPLIGQGLVHWPMEIRRGIASYLPWRELVAAGVLLCRSWRFLGQDVPLWRVFFVATWPNHARRQEERARGKQDWFQLFRERWEKGGTDFDVTEEDWLDFYAAQEIIKAREVEKKAKNPRSGPSSEELASRALQRDLKRCRDELREKRGVHVPYEADGHHLCSRFCSFHKLPNSGDTYVCEASGHLHQCLKSSPCHMCVVSEDECFLVCPASGLSYPRVNFQHEEVPDEEDPVWDPAMTEGQQMRSWLEHGYGMSEDQASNFFKD